MAAEQAKVDAMPNGPKKMLKQKDRGKLCCIVILTIVLIVLIWIVVAW